MGRNKLTKANRKCFILLKRSEARYQLLYFKSQRNFTSSDLNCFCETKAF